MPYASSRNDESVFSALESIDDESILGPTFIRDAVSTVGNVLTSPINAVVNGVKAAVVNTPAGQARMDFQQPVATKDSVERVANELRQAVQRVNQTIERNTAVVDGKVERLEKIVRAGQQQDQMNMLMPLLLSKPPKLTSIKFTNESTASPVDSVQYAAGDNMPLLMMMMMGSQNGGVGGDQNNMLMMLLLSGAFK